MGSESSKIEFVRNKKVIGARHFLETYATSIMLNVCLLVQGVLLARLLGVDGRGDYAAIILWPNIIANIGMLGTNIAVTRSAAVADEDVGPVARAGILSSLILSTLAVAIGMMLLPLLIPKADSNILGLAQIYMLLFVPASILSGNLMGLDQGQGRFRRLNLFRLLQSPVTVLLLIVLILSANANLAYCIWVTIVAFWVTALLRFGIMMREIPILGPIASLTNLLRQGLPYSVANIIGQFSHRGDQILLLWLLTKHDLGLYMVALSAAKVLANLPTSMGLVSLTIAAQEKPREGFTRIAQIFRGAVISSVTVGIVLAISIYILLPIVYGQGFADARLIGVILGVGVIMRGLTSVLDQSMKGQGKPMVGIYANLAGIMVMAVVGVVLSHFLGVIGVSLGFVVAQTARMCCWVLLTVRYYNSASILDLVPTVQDAKLISRRLKQQAALALAQIRSILRPTAKNTSNTNDNIE